MTEPHDMPDYIYAIHTSVKNTWQDAENLDENHGYVSYIWIPEETFKIDVLKVRVWAEKFRTHSKAALAGGAAVVTSGASSRETTGPSGGHWHSVSGATTTVVTPSHTHRVEIGVKTSGPSGGHSHSVSGATSTPATGTAYGGNIIGAYDSINGLASPVHKHAVTEGKTSEVGTHRHIFLTAGGTVQTTERTVQEGGGGAVYFTVKTNLVSGGAYTAGGGSHDHGPGTLKTGTPDVVDTTTWRRVLQVLPSSGVAYFVTLDHTHDVSGQTTDTVDDHTHDVEIGTVTSEAGGGAHSHKVSGQTTSTVDDHRHGMDHTHTVNIPDHTHGIDFGIYEEDITGRTLSAKLYDPDGNLVKDFGVICTDEGAVTLDLTDYFEELKYGFWRLELSASGRMRVRLLYYELCKMYAQY